jgi:phage terminase large subunit-like protein
MAIAESNLSDVIQLLPGYDPYAQAGDCRFDEGVAWFAIDFIQECCTFTQGPKAREPFILEAWQRAIVANLFGWKRPDGTRRYRECLIFVPRKNGKSELAAALLIFVLFTDQEPGAQIYSAAAKRDQTKYIRDPVKRMIAREPELRNRADVFKYSVIVDDRSYLAIAAEATTEHGGNTHMAVVDELHAQPDRELVDVLETSMIGRPQPLLVYVTTSDYEREGSICNEKHAHAQLVCQNSQDPDVGVCDPEFLPVIYEATIDDDWMDPDVWAKANPNLGVSIEADRLAVKARKAKDTPAYLNTFLRLHLNVRTEQACRLIMMDQWDACTGIAQPTPGPDAQANRWIHQSLQAWKGRRCWAGLDLSTIKDLAALVLCFPDEDDDTYDFLPFFWCPRDEALRREKAGVPYMAWARAGLIELTDGNSIDYRYIRARINELAGQYDIQEIAYDPYNASHLVTELTEEDGLNMVEMRQGMLSMGPPTKLLLRLLLERKLRHSGHKVLRWNASNVAGKTDHQENVMPSKKDSNEKIDGIVAMIMALGRASLRPGAADSVYNSRGLIVL